MGAVEFGRRTFIQATGLVTFGAWAHGPDRDWDRLRRALTGRLVRPGDDGYDTVRRPFNTVYAHRRPAAVALCADESDVARCLDFAATHDVPVAARSGGHSYAGYSVPENGLVIDLAALNGVDVDERGDARIGPGARMIDVYEGLGGVGRLLPAGTCPTVGVGGLTLGGGISVVARKYGLTCDRLLSARVVTPDGVTRHTDAQTEPDLFWALRGGGGGNFGVVTSFTFDTEPARDLVVFLLRFPADAGVDVLGAWQEWMLGTPDEMWTACEVVAGSPPTAGVIGCWAGEERGLPPLLDRLTAKVAPTSRQVLPMDYLTTMRYFAGCLPQCAPTTGAPFVASSRMLHRPVDPARAVGLMEGRRAGWVQFDSFGGEIARVRPDATAFPHRDAIASAQAYVGVGDVSEAEARRTVADVRDGLGHNTGYVNYIDPDMPEWRTAYYGRNLARLRRVARRYDPDHVLAFPQSVVPS
ncbi:FAD-dependent oxidoreductase [Saccharothrix hoggarensis]|uniref:FAD-binding protein n=1 Tax=Saccharothrix hoggarensis TaxID=913853 RepID=A0ABW3QND3_9PSEU